MVKHKKKAITNEKGEKVGFSHIYQLKGQFFTRIFGSKYRKKRGKKEKEEGKEQVHVKKKTNS